MRHQRLAFWIAIAVTEFAALLICVQALTFHKSRADAKFWKCTSCGYDHVPVRDY